MERKIVQIFLDFVHNGNLPLKSNLFVWRSPQSLRSFVMTFFFNESWMFHLNNSRVFIKVRLKQKKETTKSDDLKISFQHTCPATLAGFKQLTNYKIKREPILQFLQKH